MHGVVIAGTHSGCGKTTITLGILAALRKWGVKVQPFKAGPDFIDSGLHRLVTGKASRNLDAWMCGKDGVIKCFNKYSSDADISVIEGVMGIYDGSFSTASLAHLLNLPVVLVVDAYGMAESAGAVVKGFVEYSNPPFNKGGMGGIISGVIFNRTASDRHYKRLQDSIRDIPVLGHLPRDLDFEIPHRHLGLTVAEESPISSENIERLAEAVLEYIDVDTIAQKDNSVEKQKCGIKVTPPILPLDKGRSEVGLNDLGACRIAVAYDKAFCFYYEDNLDLLREAGAEIIRFSPISDPEVPRHANAVYIGGGYPELYPGELAGNTSMLKSISEWANAGKPIYAECGGLMYLSQGIFDFDGNFFKMAGVFPFETQIPPCPPLAKGGKGGLRPHLGYREVILKENCIVGKKGSICRGHEFHYSEIRQGSGAVDKAYSSKNNNDGYTGEEGYKFKNTLASYIHIHFGSNSDIAGNFATFIKEN